MTLEELTLELRGILRDPTVEQSLTVWINQAILELATQFEIPLLRLRTAATLSVTADEWLYDLSDAEHDDGWVYHKHVFRVASDTQTNGYSLERDLQVFDDIDFDHSTTGDAVQRVALEGDQLGVYPLATQDLSVWFYRLPEDVEDDDDEPEVPDAGFHYTVLVPMVVLKAFRVFPDLGLDTPAANTTALQLWTQRYQAGLYGDRTQQGYIQKLQQQRGGPRVRGPRLGQQLSGGAGRSWW